MNHSGALLRIGLFFAANLILHSTTVLADAKSDYESMCTACHGFGVPGAPKLGDKASWASRIDQGMEALYDHAINGFEGESGIMPPKGGFTELNNERVKAIVDYMVAEGQ